MARDTPDLSLATAYLSEPFRFSFTAPVPALLNAPHGARGRVRRPDRHPSPTTPKGGHPQGVTALQLELLAHWLYGP